MSQNEVGKGRQVRIKRVIEKRYEKRENGGKSMIYVKKKNKQRGVEIIESNALDK